MRKQIAAVLQAYWDFIQKHPFPSLLLSLVMLAACIGGIYLVAVNFPSYIPCLRSSCG